jgi:hypothetical protein
VLFDIRGCALENPFQRRRNVEDAAVGFVQDHNVRGFLGHETIGLIRLPAILCGTPRVFDRHDIPRSERNLLACEKA